MTTTESIPQVWDDERDGTFFRIATQLFSTEFCSGATVLLASYDTEDEAYGATIAAQPVVHTYEETPATHTASASNHSA